MANSDFHSSLDKTLQHGPAANRGFQKPAHHDTTITGETFNFDSPLMTVKQWKNASAAKGKIRSSRLRQFDSTYERYLKTQSANDMALARLCLSNWMWDKDKKGRWQDSVRNSHKAVEIIYQQLFTGFIQSREGLPLWLPHLSSSEEQQAMQFWAQQSKQLCQRYFRAGDQTLTVQLKKNKAGKAAVQSAKALKQLAGQLPKAKRPHIHQPNVPVVNLPHVGLPSVNFEAPVMPDLDLPDLHIPQLNQASINLPCLNLPEFQIPGAPDIHVGLKNLIANFFGFANFHVMAPYLPEIMHLIKVEFGNVFADFCVDMIPGIAQLKDGAKLLAAWGKTGYRVYQQQDAAQHEYVFSRGDASQAFAAVLRLMKRDTKAQAATAATLTARVATDALTAGTSTQATGVAKQVADVIQRLLLLGMQWREAHKVNQLLKDEQPLTYEIFSVAPLTGCYIVAHASLSDLLSMGCYLFGAKGFKDNVESLNKKHIEPMRKYAKTQIDKSIFYIPNFAHTVH